MFNEIIHDYVVTPPIHAEKEIVSWAKEFGPFDKIGIFEFPNEQNTPSNLKNKSLYDLDDKELFYLFFQRQFTGMLPLLKSFTDFLAENYKLNFVTINHLQKIIFNCLKVFLFITENEDSEKIVNLVNVRIYCKEFDIAKTRHQLHVQYGVKWVKERADNYVQEFVLE